MELPADRVATERADHAEAVGLGVLLDRRGRWPTPVSPGFTASMPRYRHSLVTRISSADRGSISPTPNVALVSPCTPSRKIVTSTFTMSPSRSAPVVRDAVADHLVDRGAHATSRIPCSRVGSDTRRARCTPRARPGRGSRWSPRPATAAPTASSTSPAASPALRIAAMISGGLTSGSSRPRGQPLGRDVGRAHDLGRHLPQRTDGARLHRLVAQPVALLVLEPAATPAGIVGSKTGHGRRLPAPPGRSDARNARGIRRVFGAKTAAGGVALGWVGGAGGQGAGTVVKPVKGTSTSGTAKEPSACW